MAVLIQGIVIELLGAQGGQGAGPLGAGHPLGHTQGQGHEVSLLHALGPGLCHLGLTQRISTVMVPSAVGHLHTLPLAVMMEDEPRGHLDLVGKRVSPQVKDTAAAQKRYFTVNMSEAERSLHVTESIVKADRL